jgi:hypothetical protein
MTRTLPPSPSTNGINGELPPATGGRDPASGRFLPGNKGGPGNPHARATAARRKALTEAVTPEAVRRVAKKVLDLAEAGDVTNKTAAELMLAELIHKGETADRGIADPYEQHRMRPLAEHLTDWEAALLAGGATAKHVRQTVACSRRVIEGCGFVLMAELSASRVQQ